MRDLYEMRKFWRAHPSAELGLCTIIKKIGSGYRPEGAKKIIGRKADSSGLLSGGCLEGAIDQTMRDRWHELPFRQSFSTQNEEDRLQGYQAGCSGIIEILFERLPACTDDFDLFLPFGSKPRGRGVCVSLAPDTLAHRALVSSSRECEGEAFFDEWQKPIELSVIGCGPDANAFFEFSQPLGWTTQFYDYRQGHAERIDGAVCLAVTQIAEAIAASEHSAVMLMTHNYQADVDILATLVGKKIGYLGCLGPLARFTQMRLDLKAQYGLDLPQDFEKIIHAPPGQNPKGRTPEEIALSVVAEIQSTFASKGPV